MDGKQGKSGRKAPASRDERLKAALKANLARRKAQSRARQASDAADQSKDDNEN
ncbi:hypothetical protein [Ponticoccus alexandrii]|uniref:hypothetical protein n=1 Tax=Ponticoccus alexandrii TaxID=1943633 RepID=UPI0003D1A817|nr:hypothetical protein [Ponticoccus alexandrii]